MNLEARSFRSESGTALIDVSEIEETSISTDNNRFFLNIRIDGRHWYECTKTFHSEKALNAFVDYITAKRTLSREGLLGIEYSQARKSVAQYESQQG